MRIREGKRYVTRDGRVTGLMQKHWQGQWVASLDGGFSRTWGPDGIYIRTHGGDPLDLVAEYREDGK